MSQRVGAKAPPVGKLRETRDEWMAKQGMRHLLSSFEASPPHPPAHFIRVDPESALRSSRPLQASVKNRDLTACPPRL